VEAKSPAGGAPAAWGAARPLGPLPCLPPAPGRRGWGWLALTPLCWGSRAVGLLGRRAVAAALADGLGADVPPSPACPPGCSSCPSLFGRVRGCEAVAVGARARWLTARGGVVPHRVSMEGWGRVARPFWWRPHLAGLRPARGSSRFAGGLSCGRCLPSWIGSRLGCCSVGLGRPACVACGGRWCHCSAVGRGVCLALGWLRHGPHGCGWLVWPLVLWWRGLLGVNAFLVDFRGSLVCFGVGGVPVGRGSAFRRGGGAAFALFYWPFVGAVCCCASPRFLHFPSSLSSARPGPVARSQISSGCAARVRRRLAGHRLSPGPV